jgi:Flp pilus assembly protein TadD
MIDKAQQLSAEGKHQEAIEQLLDTVKKYPVAAGRVQSFLGVEYIQTEQYTQAVKALREAVRLLPHDAINHSNLALSLAAAGEIPAAIVEVRRAVELDPENPKMQGLLAALGYQ